MTEAPKSTNSRDPILPKKAITRCVAAALGLTGTHLAMSQSVLEEIIVTARQRAETSQEIPMMVQTLSGEDIEKQGITTLEDLSRFVAGLNVTATTPGQNTIIFRGISDGGGFLVDPTAAIYLDEQPMSLTSASPDIYPVDIARVEALAGPQSTLYGASSQSGAVRVITNKPDPTEFTASIGAGFGSTTNGGSSHDLDATVNIPLSDSVAIRLSGFTSTDAGFIDNVMGDTITDTVFGSGLGGQKTNESMLEEDFNDVDWQGGRAAVRWFVDDNWTVTGSANYQKIDAGGYNDYDPLVGDLETVKFAKEVRTDEWLQTSLIIEGDLGFAQLVSATSYYDREMVYTNDTQSYAAYFHYSFGVYYGYATYDFGLDPTGYLVNDQSNDSLTQEIRLSGSGERLNWTLGGFWQESEEFWDFHSYVDGFRNSPAFAAWSYYYPGIAPTDAWWNSYQGTDRTDMAVFGEMDVELIENRLTALLGGRWYEVDREIVYGVERPDEREEQYLPDREGKDDGFIPKFGLEFQVTEDVMLYGVYSEGYRVGGINRNRGLSQGGPTLPYIYQSDLLENKELGLKSTFADGKIVFNAVYYDMKWNDMQLEVTDPSFNLATYSEVDEFGDPLFGSVPFQIAVGNIGDATVTGIDVDFKALLSDNMEIGFNLTDIRDAYVDAPEFYEEPRAAGGQIPTGLDPKTELPLFADNSYSMYVEYSGFNFMGGDGAFRLQHNFIGKSLNQLTDGYTSARLTQGDYRVSDAILTLDMDKWQARIYVNNLSDERGITYEDSSDIDPLWGRNSSNVIRPRNWGVSLRRSF